MERRRPVFGPEQGRAGQEPNMSCHRAVFEAPVLQHCATDPRPGLARDKWFLATVAEFDPSKKLLAEKSRGSRMKLGQNKHTLQAVSFWFLDLCRCKDTVWLQECTRTFFKGNLKPILGSASRSE